MVENSIMDDHVANIIIIIIIIIIINGLLSTQSMNNTEQIE